MNFLLFNESRSTEVVELFKRVFSASEGEAEGRVIADFVAALVATTKPRDLLGCIAVENETIVAAIFFSRFTVPGNQRAFILSPVAVSTEEQGKGIGQKLIGYGLEHIKSLNANLVFTYGDPAFYSKVGFEQISEDLIRAPYPLSQPDGWLAQSLDDADIQALDGPTQCVEALNNPDLW
jgi:predicted N-acetyltransferase YhbS